MGMKVAAVSVMCQDRRVFDAMAMAGTPCPYNGKIGEEAYKMWKANPQKMPAKVEIDNERTQAKEELKTGLTIGGPCYFGFCLIVQHTQLILQHQLIQQRFSPYTLDLDDGTISQPLEQLSCQYFSNMYMEQFFCGEECQNTFAISYAINQALTGIGC